ncbi:MAG: MotA/TolQ/ExbB proton channel family protein [Deltaproteobacteria bacterium]
MIKKVLGTGAVCVAALLASYMLVTRSAFFARGGPLLVPVFACSFLAWASVFAKLFQMASWRQDAEELLRSVFEFIERQRIKEALEATEKRPTPVARVLRAGILKYERRREEVREALEDEFMRQAPVLDDGMPLIKTLLELLPLLGFLGGLAGMVNVLGTVESKVTHQVAVGFADLLPGGWELALCGFTALFVAVPLYLAYRFLSARIERERRILEQTATVFLEDLIERRVVA